MRTPDCRAWQLQAQETYSRMRFTPKIRPCMRAFYAYRLNIGLPGVSYYLKSLVHTRESDMHAVHPLFFTLHAQDLVELWHALQTGAHPRAFPIIKMKGRFLRNCIDVK